jgi:outer membrane biosynthesis protein TonB
VTRRRIHYFAGLSILAHAVIFALPPPRPNPATAGAPAAAFLARIVEAPAPKAAPAPEPTREPAVRHVVPKREARPPQRVEPAAPMTTPVERPAPIQTARAAPAPQFDMLAMINARRERRRAVEQELLQLQRQHDQASTAIDAGAASIQRNLETLHENADGTGGVFVVLSKGTRTGEFAFNGFRPDTNRRWREVIEVDAGVGGDLERAMVRRMIELIRTHYDGDFVWRSHRLGKSLVLSARPADGAGLEEFFMREFFGTPTLAHKR